MPGCRAKPQARLALHFSTAHPSIKGERRLALLRDALRLAPVPGGGKPKLTRPKGQPTLHQQVNQPSPIQPSPNQPSLIQPSPNQPSPNQPSLIQPSPNQPSPSDEEYHLMKTDRETGGIGGEREAEGGLPVVY